MIQFIDMGNLDNQLAPQILDWYDQNRRTLPWRESPSLYKTVVSEFMLQQTQVKTMLPYFDRWLERYPTFQALAAATEDEVVRSWEGLGYYRRARNLHKVAQLWIAASPKPNCYEMWVKFPGIGPYMAAAIASIDFSEPVVVVDGNVIRVIARIRGIKDSFKGSAPATKAIRPLAQTILSRERPGDFNQALMELGATVCKPQSPLCINCPWCNSCDAKKHGTIDMIPNIVKSKTIKVIRPRVFVVNEKSDHLLLSEGAMTGRLKGIYELPLAENFNLTGAKKLGTIKRGISNEMITETIYELSHKHVTTSVQQKAKSTWISLQNLSDVSLSGPHRKWLSGFLSSNEDSC